MYNLPPAALALGLAASLTLLPALSVDANTAGYALVGVTGQNNRQDVNAASCDLLLGCFDNTGARCSDAPGARCDVQVTPAGRCSQGTGGCIWPLGAGLCESAEGETADPVSCLSDDYRAYLAASEAWLIRNLGDPAPAEPRPVSPGETTNGESSMCENVQGSSGICDMSTNLADCDCTGRDPLADPTSSDPSAPSWEGGVCGGGSNQAACSDGDPRRNQVGYGTNLCIQLCVAPACQPEPNCGDAHTQNGPGSAIGVKYMSGENPDDFFTLQRRPGTAVATPSAGPILSLNTTYAAEIAPVGTGDFAAFGLRRVRAWSNSFHADEIFNGKGVNGIIDDTGPTNYFCDVPAGAGWGSGQPVSGICAGGSGTFCIADQDCPTSGLCDPNTFVYCHDNDRDPHDVENEASVDGTGFVFTRALTPAERIGECPPDCGLAYDFDTFEEEAIDELGARTADPRAGIQLALDNLEGERAGAGHALFVQPIVSVNTLVLGDTRCYIGGDPDRTDPDDIGRCANSPDSCNPRLSTNANGCPNPDDCMYCQGTADAANAPHGTNSLYARFGGNAGFDPARGNPEALPIGYDTHDNPALDLHGRIGRINGRRSTTEVSLVLILTHGAARSVFKDNTCNQAIGDTCTLGQVTGGAAGIGASPTNIVLGDPVPHEPSGPGYRATLPTIPAASPGAGDPSTLVTTRDYAVGADGIPGCIGDNVHPGVNPPAPCDERLGDPGSPGSTGLDDPPLSFDYSVDQNGSDMRQATRSRFTRMQNPFAVTPTWTNNATFAVRDLPTPVNAQGLDVVGKNEVTFCPIISRDDTGRFKTACLDEDTDQDGWLDEQDGCPLNPAVGRIDEVTNPDTGGVENPNSDPGGFLPDGVADACQCGDVNDDGRVTGNDSTFIKRACLGLAPFENTVVGETGCAQSQPGPPANAQPFNRDKCDVGSGGGGPGGCSGNDSTVVRRTTLGLILPGIKNTCTAYGQLPPP